MDDLFGGCRTFSVAAGLLRWLPTSRWLLPLAVAADSRWLPPFLAHLQRQHTGSWLGGCRPPVAADRAVGPTFRDLPTSHRRHPGDGSAGGADLSGPANEPSPTSDIREMARPCGGADLSGPAAVYRRPSAVQAGAGSLRRPREQACGGRQPPVAAALLVHSSSADIGSWTQRRLLGAGSPRQHIGSGRAVADISGDGSAFWWGQPFGTCRPASADVTGAGSVAADLRWLPTLRWRPPSGWLPTCEFQDCSPTSCSSGQLHWPPTPSCPGALSSDFEIWID